MLIDHKSVSDDTASVQNKLFNTHLTMILQIARKGWQTWCGGVFFGSTYLPTKVLNSQGHWDSVPGMVLNPFLSGCYLSVKL